MEIINLSDIVEDNGKTVRENNMEKQHNIPLGQVVELDIDPEYCGCIQIYKKEQTRDGNEVALCYPAKIKMIVVGHNRDCDGTPLYCISDIPVKANKMSFLDKHLYRMACKFYASGWDENSLKVIKDEFVPIQFNHILDYWRDQEKQAKSMGPEYSIIGAIIGRLLQC